MHLPGHFSEEFKRLGCVHRRYPGASPVYARRARINSAASSVTVSERTSAEVLVFFFVCLFWALGLFASSAGIFSLLSLHRQGHV